MNQSRPAPGAEIPIGAPVTVWPAVHRDGALVRRRDLEEWEDGCHAVRRRRLVSAFRAVADEDGGRLGRRRREFDEPALAVPFHSFVG